MRAECSSFLGTSTGCPSSNNARARPPASRPSQRGAVAPVRPPRLLQQDSPVSRYRLPSRLNSPAPSSFPVGTNHLQPARRFLRARSVSLVAPASPFRDSRGDSTTPSSFLDQLEPADPFESVWPFGPERVCRTRPSLRAFRHRRSSGGKPCLLRHPRSALRRAPRLEVLGTNFTLERFDFRKLCSCEPQEFVLDEDT